MRDHRAAAWLLAAATYAWAAPAAAGTDLVACRHAYEEQQFRRAIELCTEVATDPAAERRTIAAAWEVAGMANLVLRKRTAARAAFCQTLAIDADYRPTDPIYPARFVTVFDEVRSTVCRLPLGLEVAPALRGGVVAMRVRIHGPIPENASLVVVWRPAAEVRWRHAAAAAGGARVAIDLERDAVERLPVDYYVVLMKEGRALARRGTPDHPQRLALLPGPEPPEPAAPAGPWWRRHWLWLAIGGAAATIAVVAGVTAASNSPARGTLDTLRLP